MLSRLLQKLQGRRAIPAQEPTYGQGRWSEAPSEATLRGRVQPIQRGALADWGWLMPPVCFQRAEGAFRPLASLPEPPGALWREPQLAPRLAGSRLACWPECSMEH